MVVSIITPTYNHEKFIGQCIESVLAQTFSDWEQIIIDDGSTDATPEIIKSYKDPRIRYLRREHRGVSMLCHIYNDALSLARGEFLAILEGDDFWPHDKLEKQIGAFGSPEIALVWGKGIVTDEAGHPLFYARTPIKTVNQLEDFVCSQILRMMRRCNPVIPTSSVMVRRSKIVQIGGFQPSPSHIYVDFPTWLKLATTHHCIFRFMNTLLGFRRTHSRQVSLMMRAQLFYDQAELVNNYKLEDGNTYSKYFRAKGDLAAHNWRRCRHLFGSLLFNQSVETRDKIVCLLGFTSSFIHVDLVKFILRLKKLLLRILRRRSITVGR